MTLRPLCLDQSLTSCGWARLDGQGGLQSGWWHLADGSHDRANSFVQLHRNLSAQAKLEPFTHLVVEAPILTRMDKVPKLVALYGLVAHAESWARAKGLPPVEIVDQRHWRDTFLGKGRKGLDREQVKRMAVERCRQFGFNPANTDEAEAIGILDHWLHAKRVHPSWRREVPFLECV